MPVSCASLRHRRFHALALSLLTASLLAACGGGGSSSSSDSPPGDSPPAGGGTGTPPAPANIEALAGDWVQKGCVRTGNQSFKRILRARITSATTLDYSEGVLSFSGNDCAGLSQQAGPSPLGTVTFTRTEARADLSAYWGELRTVTNTRSGTIWTLRPANLLCLLGDEIPTNQRSLDSVAASLATVPQDNCFSR